MTPTLKPRTHASRYLGRKYDCGKHGRLTTKEIAAVAGISAQSVRVRVKAGTRGEALCAPAWEGLRRKKVECRRPLLLTAFRLCKAFPDRLPTEKEVRAAYPMSPAAARRWRQAMRDVMEAA